MNEDELVKCGKKETVDKKKQSARRKCVVRSEWFQSHEPIVDVNRAAQKGQQWQRRCQEISLKKPSWQEISLRTIHARKSGNI